MRLGSISFRRMFCAGLLLMAAQASTAHSTRIATHHLLASPPQWQLVISFPLYPLHRELLERHPESDSISRSSGKTASAENSIFRQLR